jgi:5-methylcytosine-specific restriction endonuclease McrA
MPDAKWYRANREKAVASAVAWAKANPERVKANQAAWYQRTRAQLLAKGKVWAKANPERVKAIQAAYRQKNRERLKAIQAAYRQNNRAQLLAKSQAYNSANRDGKARSNKEWYLANREMVIARSTAWVQANSERVKANKTAHYVVNREQYYSRFRNRRALKRKTTIGPINWPAILEYFGHRCAYCLGGGTLHQDHIEPLARGGTHTHDNLVPACQRCNLKKGTKMLLQLAHSQILDEAGDVRRLA